MRIVEQNSITVSLFERIQSALSEFAPEIVTSDNMRKYQNVFYSNDEYYLLTDGRSATEYDIKETIDYGKDFDAVSVHSWGFSTNNEAIAFLSILEDYPEPDMLYIGLFLVDEKNKRKHIGSCIIKAVADCAFEMNYRSIKLSVLQENISGVKFWESLGFRKVSCANRDGNLSMEYKQG